jgi:hypothetical protein
MANWHFMEHERLLTLPCCVVIRTIDALWEASREMVVNWKRLVLSRRETSSILIAGVL